MTINTCWHKQLSNFDGLSSCWVVKAAREENQLINIAEMSSKNIKQPEHLKLHSMIWSCALYCPQTRNIVPSNLFPEAYIAQIINMIIL